MIDAKYENCNHDVAMQNLEEKIADELICVRCDQQILERNNYLTKEHLTIGMIKDERFRIYVVYTRINIPYRTLGRT